MLSLPLHGSFSSSNLLSHAHFQEHSHDTHCSHTRTHAGIHSCMHPSAHTLALTHAQPHARITLHTVTPTLRLHVPAFTHTCPHTHRHTSRSHRARMHVRIITYVQPCAVSCQANTNATHPGQQSSHVCICVNTHRSPLMRSCLSTRVTYIHAVVRAHIHAPVRMYKGRLSVTRFLSSVCLSEHPHPHLAHPNTHTHTSHSQTPTLTQQC